MSWLQNTFRGLLFKNVAFNLTIQDSKLVDTEDAVACVFSNLDEQKMSELIECLNSISAKWVKKEA